AAKRAGPEFGRRYRPSNEKAAGQQNGRIHGADDNLGMSTRRGKISRIAVPVGGISADQPAEKQDLGCKKCPHAELRRVVLLRQRGILECRTSLRHFAGSLPADRCKVRALQRAFLRNCVWAAAMASAIPGLLPSTGLARLCGPRTRTSRGRTAAEDRLLRGSTRQ